MNMFNELKIACAKKNISIAEFARLIGKSRTSVVYVATCKAKSAYILDQINKFISDSNTFNKVDESTNEYVVCKEYALKTGMRPESVANKARSGGLKAKKIGKKWFIHKSELQ